MKVLVTHSHNDNHRFFVGKIGKVIGTSFDRRKKVKFGAITHFIEDTKLRKIGIMNKLFHWLWNDGFVVLAIFTFIAGVAFGQFIWVWVQ